VITIADASAASWRRFVAYRIQAFGVQSEAPLPWHRICLRAVRLRGRIPAQGRPTHHAEDLRMASD